VAPLTLTHTRRDPHDQRRGGITGGLRPTWRGISAATVLFAIILAEIVTGNSTLLLVVAAMALPLVAAPVVVMRRAQRADGIALQMFLSPPVVPVGTPCDLMLRLTTEGRGALPPMSLDRPSENWRVGFGGETMTPKDRPGRLASSGVVAVGVARLIRWDQISSEDGSSALPLPTRRRGVFTFGPLHLWVHDPFGFCGRTVAQAPPVSLVVRPRDAAESPQQAARSGPSGSTESSNGGWAGHSDDPGGEWSGLRPYEPGDRLHLLSWQAEARSGALLVHDFRPDSAEVISLVLDDRAGVHRREAFENSLGMIYGLALQSGGQTTDIEVSTFSGRRLRGSTTRDGLVDLAVFLAQTQPMRIGATGGTAFVAPGARTLVVTTPTALPTLPPSLSRDDVVVVE
jgi:Protein of unknown function DUF58